jgi:hypothetical protein
MSLQREVACIRTSTAAVRDVALHQRQVLAGIERSG